MLIVQMIESGEKNYLFVEIMACPGGCINGGGQPTRSDSVSNYVDYKALRSKALYDYDKNIIEECVLNPSVGNYGYHIPKGVWHCVQVLAPNTVIFEVKEGPYTSCS